jgi:hypothetical protein
MKLNAATTAQSRDRHEVGSTTQGDEARALLKHVQRQLRERYLGTTRRLGNADQQSRQRVEYAIARVPVLERRHECRNTGSAIADEFVGASPNAGTCHDFHPSRKRLSKFR